MKRFWILGDENARAEVIMMLVGHLTAFYFK